MWWLLEQYTGEHLLMGACIRRSSDGGARRRPDGLVEGHAYTPTKGMSKQGLDHSGAKRRNEAEKGLHELREEVRERGATHTTQTA